ncbi:restriction endonuclease [uncultured Desulfosarcina sp.]|uniref:restriction endonuclease n=1 Tax=uncultured Desulfosarcina sp. TaxID=218289 RepID=UPI0029C5FFC0|nr:restriction endonuclease [uncultured Desulfosarcina sp.]
MDKKLKSIDIRLIDDLFEMGGGYVLDFTNRTFSEFFIDELGVNIDDPRFEVEGTSKAKRLRYYLRTVRIDDVVRALLALWEYRETLRRRSGEKEKLPDHKIEFLHLIKRLGGKPPEEIKVKPNKEEPVQINEKIANELFSALLNLSSLAPQPRGYAFEKFLKQLFDANGMEGRASFRLTGEQIDGSFQLSGETYLLEAKWQNNPVDASDLRSFNAKVEDKASWSRGLFVSYSGFSEDGLVAYGKGKSVICMDGFDLSEMLHNRLSLKEVLSKKARHAAETGQPFIQLRDLF